jgi:hypothetical protein
VLLINRRNTHGNANDGTRLFVICSQSAMLANKMRYGNALAHHIEENVKAVGMGRISRDDDDESDRVDRSRFGYDSSFLRETKRLARVVHGVLACPETVGNQHCNAEWIVSATTKETESESGKETNACKDR